jgi:hypothetical protein
MTLDEFALKVREIDERRRVLEADRRALALEASDSGIAHQVICPMLKMGPATLVEIRRKAGRPMKAWSRT